MKKIIRAEIKKIKACKIHLPQTARQMDKGTEKKAKIREHTFLKKIF